MNLEKNSSILDVNLSEDTPSFPLHRHLSIFCIIQGPLVNKEHNFSGKENY